ncbi:MAG: glycosyltransferase family 4 protein [Gemmatimonadales bacterium]
MAVQALRHALASAGHEVAVVAPHPAPPGVPYTMHRFAFNATLRRSAVGPCELIIGWDMDGFRLAGRGGTPFVPYVSGMLADEARFERGAVRWSMQAQALAERRSVRRARRVLTVSRYLTRRIADGYQVSAEKIGVVPPAFDGPRWLAAYQRAQRNEEGVLAVGHLYPRKDHATLVRAAGLLRKERAASAVTIVGDGPERRALARLVRASGLDDAVRLTGQVKLEALIRHYASCAVFCLPSRQEGFGIVLLEAMAAGKPIVACRDTAAEEIVEDGVNGLLVPPGDPTALANAIQRLLHDPALRRRYGTANAAKVRRYTPHTAAQRLLAAVAPVLR